MIIKKPEFLAKLALVVEQAHDAVLVGGDFNLVRDAKEKSTGRVTGRWVDAFNNFITSAELRELHRIRGSFTWSNNQETPIRVVLDRVLVSGKWEEIFPLTTVQVITRIGSDHNPLLVDIGENAIHRTKIFRFEPSWLNQESFRDWVLQKWPRRTDQYIVDHWHKVSSCLRRAMKGWGANVGSEQRKSKQNLLLNIKYLDEEVEKKDLSKEEWAKRYALEDRLMDIYKEEDVFWQKRGGEQWLLEGDANT